MVMYAPVDGPPARSPGPNLLNSVLRPNDGARWQLGLAWRPETCVNVQGFMPCDLTSLPADEVTNGPEYYEPPAYRVWDECTTLSTGVSGLDVARLRRQADAVASFEIAHELWTGELNPANAHLADGTATVVTTTGDFMARLRQLEQAAKTAAKGQQVVLHVPISQLPPPSDLRRVGDTLYTDLDSIVVADAGYPGTGPVSAGTSEVQTVTVTNATGGTFTLTFSGQTTAPIAYNATGATVAAALNALTNLDGVSASGAAGGPWLVTFPAAMGDVAQMTIDGTALTDNGTDLHTQTVTTTTPGVAPAPADGTWAYATGLVAVRLGDIDLPADATMAATLDRTTNRQRIWAERAFAAYYDPCVKLATNLSA